MEIELERVENAVRIPIECLYTDNVGDYVFVSEDGIVRKKYFETGVRDVEHVQALTVIKAGDHIVSDMDAAQYEGEKIKEIMTAPEL